MLIHCSLEWHWTASMDGTFVCRFRRGLRYCNLGFSLAPVVFSLQRISNDSTNTTTRSKFALPSGYVGKLTLLCPEAIWLVAL